jgi:hypothetical protein
MRFCPLEGNRRSTLYQVSSSLKPEFVGFDL